MRSDRATYEISANKQTILPPVTLAITCGAAWLHDFLTVEQARELADALNATADEVKAAASPSPTFDEVVDQKMASKKFIEIEASPEVSA